MRLVFLLSVSAQRGAYQKRPQESVDSQPFRNAACNQDNQRGKGDETNWPGYSGSNPMQGACSHSPTNAQNNDEKEDDQRNRHG